MPLGSSSPGRTAAILVFAALFCSCLSGPGRGVERRVTLELEGNPTTGYSWTYIMEGEVLREVLAEYRPAPAEEGMTGRGGVFVFVFESLKPGRAELIFSYRRPWEENTEPAETRYFVFTVDEAGRIIRSGS